MGFVFKRRNNFSNVNKGNENIMHTFVVVEYLNLNGNSSLPSTVKSISQLQPSTIMWAVLNIMWPVS